MGTNTIQTVSIPSSIDIDHVNQYFTALAGDFVSRNVVTGVSEDNVNKLGRATHRWKELHVTDIFLNGALFNPSLIDVKYSINSGATRTDSGQPDFLRADGVGASATILATATDLKITADNISATITADISVTSLTTAPPLNNTALVNDGDLTGANETKYVGERAGDPITIDTVGTEISDRIGEYVCMKTPTGEYMLAFVETATTLTRCFRGYFFDDAGAPIVRGVLSDNDTLTLVSLGWVFMDNDGVTVDVSYRSPKYSGVEPLSPVVDDYWFDLKNRLWMRHDGASFKQVDRMLIGVVVIDTANCIASRSFDFAKDYKSIIDIEIEIESVTKIKTQKGYSALSVYGQIHELYAGRFEWDMTIDLESGLVEAPDTLYYAYVTEEGAPKLSDERPYDREADLKGFYHPFHSWRYVGVVLNDSSSDITVANSKNGTQLKTEVFSTAGTFTFLPLPNVKSVKSLVTGGGGGGGGTATNSSGDGGTGGTSSFGSHNSATGGFGGKQSSHIGGTYSVGGAGGTGSGGDINMDGEGGGVGVGYSTDDGTIPKINSGRGGGSAHGGGAVGVVRISASGLTNGIDGGDYGGGGSGAADQGSTTQGGAGAGGGGGGTSIKFITSGLKATEIITVGVGGAFGNGNRGDGGAGGDGIVTVEYQ